MQENKQHRTHAHGCVGLLAVVWGSKTVPTSRRGAYGRLENKNTHDANAAAREAQTAPKVHKEQKRIQARKQKQGRERDGIGVGRDNCCWR